MLDPFAGSNTTGQACEEEGRRWIAVERERAYLEGSRFRFESEATHQANGKKGRSDGQPLLF